MSANSIVVRGVVLLVSAVLAMPFSTHGAGVIGGDDVDPCNTVIIGGQDCAVKSGVEGRGDCIDQKSQCKGCESLSETREIKCKSEAATCGHSDCTPNQTQGVDSGETCISAACKSM